MVKDKFSTADKLQEEAYNRGKAETITSLMKFLDTFPKGRKYSRSDIDKWVNKETGDTK